MEDSDFFAAELAAFFGLHTMSDPQPPPEQPALPASLWSMLKVLAVVGAIVLAVVAWDHWKSSSESELTKAEKELARLQRERSIARTKLVTWVAHRKKLNLSQAKIEETSKKYIQSLVDAEAKVVAESNKVQALGGKWTLWTSEEPEGDTDRIAVELASAERRLRELRRYAEHVPELAEQISPLAEHYRQEVERWTAASESVPEPL